MTAAEDAAAWGAAYRAKQQKRREALEVMNTFEVNGAFAFHGDPSSLRDAVLGQAHGLGTVIANALDAAERAENDTFSPQPLPLARAVDAMTTLIALAIFAEEGVQ